MKQTRLSVHRLLLCSLLVALMVRSDSIISGFSDKSYLSGPKITSKDLQGRLF